jgi:kynurenine formamidase
MNFPSNQYLKLQAVLLTGIICLYSCKEPIAEPKFTLEDAEWIDLTHPFDSSTLYWPNDQGGFEHPTDSEGLTELGYFYSSYSIRTPEHGGTHLDAPVHFSIKGQKLDEIPLSSLTGSAIVVDVSSKALQNPDYQILPSDLLEWEEKNGSISPEMIILFHTGYGNFYPNREKYFGSSKIGPDALDELHFPGLHPSTADFLISKKVKAVGLDTPSLDYGQSVDFKTHQILMNSNIPGFENVANLDKLPANELYVIALPMNIRGGSGGPLRIIATKMSANLNSQK